MNNSKKETLSVYAMTAFILFATQVAISLLAGFFIKHFLFVRILWTAVCAWMWWICVIKPTFDLLHKPRASKQSEVIVDAHYETINETSAPQGKDASMSTQERDTVRSGYQEDVMACLADSAYSFYWAGDSVKRIYLYKAGEDNQAYAACIKTDINNRVVAVESEIAGKEVTFMNVTYSKAKQAETLSRREPVDQFLAEVLPDAAWQWKNYDEGTIILSSERKGVKNLLMKVHFKKDSTVSSIIGELNNKKVRIVRAPASAKKQGATAAAPARSSASSAAKKAPGAENCERHGNISRVKATDTAVPLVEDEPATVAPAKAEAAAPKKQEKAPAKPAPAPAAAAATTTPADGHLAVTDDPPISDEVAKSNAKLLADYIVGELAELAMGAAENGEDNFVYAWPEGIQSLREAEFLAAEITERGVFKDIEVNADNQTLRFYGIHV